MSANAGVPDEVKIRVVMEQIEKILEPYPLEKRRRILAGLAVLYGLDDIAKELFREK
jgi:hypothetical protein